MRSLLILLPILAVANGQIIMNGACEDVSVHKNFNLASYSGTWYEIYRYGQSYQSSGDCVQANYTLDSGRFLVENSMVLNRNLLTINGDARISVNAENGEAKLVVNFPSTGNQFSDYWVLATDYQSYSLVYACHNLPNNNKRVSSWILSRTKSLSPQNVLALDPIMQVSKELFWEIYRETSQTGESCEFDITTTTDCPTTTPEPDVTPPEPNVITPESELL